MHGRRPGRPDAPGAAGGQRGLVPPWRGGRARRDARFFPPEVLPADLLSPRGAGGTRPPRGAVAAERRPSACLFVTAHCLPPPPGARPPPPPRDRRCRGLLQRGALLPRPPP